MWYFVRKCGILSENMDLFAYNKCSKRIQHKHNTKGNPLLPHIRHKEIIAFLRTHGVIRVCELASRFEVTDETIRRDLKKLEESGLLKRTHGGAVPTEMSPESIHDRSREAPFATRRTIKLTEKRAIAQAALQRIEPNMTIGLDPSTTCCELARMLPDIQMTVVTNSPIIASILADTPNVRLISLGGLLDRDGWGFCGSLAEQSLEKMTLDISFMSCRGIDPLRGLSDPMEEPTLLKRKMISRSKRTILLVDHTKFLAGSVVPLARHRDMHEVITDNATPRHMLHPFRSIGVPITIV